jgi:hypothetical protein
MLCNIATHRTRFDFDELEGLSSAYESFSSRFSFSVINFYWNLNRARLSPKFKLLASHLIKCFAQASKPRGGQTQMARREKQLTQLAEESVEQET